VYAFYKRRIFLSKRNLNIIIIAVLGVVLTIGIVFFTASNPDNTDPNASDVISVIDGSDKSDTYITSTPADEPAVVPTPTEEPEEPFVPATEMDLDPSSITVFVNKEHSLPKKYIPENLVTVNVYFHLLSYDERTMMRPEAAEALEQLFASAEEAGYKLSGVSGYRSYTRQYNIFTNNILTKGKEHTLKYSAAPGTSEHQTGLAMDVSCESLRYDLSTSFSETPEGIWLSQNAYHYGYIIRYPKGKGDITGYAYEPWHIRYVGKGLAKYLYENDLTLEEYYKYTPSEGFDYEALYADLINITPSLIPSISPSITPSLTPGITPIPTGADGVIVDENGEIIDGEPGVELSPTISPEITVKPTISLTPTPEDNTEKPDATPIVSEVPGKADTHDNTDNPKDDLTYKP
jgi:D-alanyl-D-alanine carboxypeptidase